MEEEGKMIPLERCPICGGQIVEKSVEKILRGGNDTAVMSVTAEVCLKCGERIFAEEVIRRFEEIRTKLAKRDTSAFRPVGTTYQVVSPV
jgi:YgiT-type zinc finger domain-containing protein